MPIEHEERNEQRIICQDCGRELSRWDSQHRVHNSDGTEGVVCRSCLVHYSRCPYCRQLFKLTAMQIVGTGDYVCAQCVESLYETCSDCGRLFYNGDMMHMRDGSPICNRCSRNRNLTCCDNCGNLTPRTELEPVFANAGLCCPECAASEAHKAFHGYHYKPKPQFQHTQHDLSISDGRYYGVELEIDWPDASPSPNYAPLPECCHMDMARRLQQLGRPIYMKHDGSLSDEGVEIVTHPCSLSYHLTTNMWKEICQVCKDAGYASQNTTTCGLHVHVSREGLGENNSDRNNTAGKLMLLADSIWDDLLPFTRRKSEDLDHWAQRPYIAVPINRPYDDQFLIQTAYNSSNGHYSAINTTPQATVEFRVFKGTLNPTAIKATLQLVDNMVTYARTHTAKECIKARMRDVLSVNRTKALVKYCQSVGLLSPT